MVNRLRATGMARWLVVPVAIAVLVSLAGLSLGRVYHGSLLAELMAGAAVGSVVVSIVFRRAPAWLVAVICVGALAGYALFAVAVSARAGDVGGDLAALTADAARNAVPRLLTALIPVEAQPDTVLGPVVLAWLAGFAGAELAVRAGRPAVALVPPTLLYAGALVLVGPNGPATAWHPAAFAATGALGLAAARAHRRGERPPAFTGPDRARLRLRTAAGVAAGLAVTLAAMTVAAPLVARAVDRAPADPRAYVDPPSLDVLDQNPLIRLSGWAAYPQQRLFDVEVMRGSDEMPQGEDASGAAIGRDTRLRLAVLTDWDGVTWHMAAAYRNAGRVLPPVDAPPGRPAETGERAPVRTIEERITVGELQGRLMPAVSQPRRIDGVRVAYDPATGTLLHAVPLTPGTRYTVTSISPGAEVDLLPAVDVPSGPAVARFLAVGDEVPPDLSRLAEQISMGESSPYQRALALESFLAEHYRYAGDAPSGHSYPNLRFFLFADPRAGGRRGTAEQFAAAYAALGRLMGLPTRVVVGFRTPAGGGTVTGADATAWPEVLFDEVGWVPFDPMPDSDTQPQPLEDEYLPKPPPPTSPPASVEPSELATWSAPASPPAAVAVRGGPGVAVIAGGVGAAVLAALAVLLALVALARAARRRRRLGRGSPPERVLGAWNEVLDSLALAGAPPPPHLAAAEIAAHAAAVADVAPSGRGHSRGGHSRRPRPPVPQLADLAAKVNAVGFAPVGVGEVAVAGGELGAGAGDVSDEIAAETAAIQAREYARALRARRPWWRRLWWRVHPRPLLRGVRPPLRRGRMQRSSG